MKDGFIKVAAGSVDVTVADPDACLASVAGKIDEADKAGVNLLVLPELCVTGYTCGDLFYSDLLLEKAESTAEETAAMTKGKYPVVVFGMPLRFRDKLFNCAAVAYDGKLLGIVPKAFLPNYGEFYEMRQFTSASALNGETGYIRLGDACVPFGTELLFRHEEMQEYCFGVELCEDVWAAETPSGALCRAGALIIANPSASDEVIGKEPYRRALISSTSARLLCGYVYANAAASESTQDMVFSAHHLIAENGALLAEHRPFSDGDLIVSEIDVKKLAHERRRNTTWQPSGAALTEIRFCQPVRDTELTRRFEKNPFVPPVDSQISERADAILKIQSYGLKKRLEHAHAKTAVIGISGGLDSTLALLAAVRAMELLNRPHTDIVAVTMPCFGTTHRTKSNAVTLCEELGVTLRKIDITASVRQHFTDIGQDEHTYDITFENGQARERTQVLMDIANKTGGLVVGTGDLSELALGWATYNGDQMSMYGVNASVPKTLVRYIVRYEAQNASPALSAVLYDILDTPVSPELLPATGSGEISQKTEDLVGPYELHDFFLYQILRFGSSPRKIYRLAKRSYCGVYDDAVILKWLRVFLHRFFNQQFKRSCMPDGPKVGSATLSPRGDWRMPSDASFRLWLAEADSLQ